MDGWPALVGSIAALVSSIAALVVAIEHVRRKH